MDFLSDSLRIILKKHLSLKKVEYLSLTVPETNVPAQIFFRGLGFKAINTVSLFYGDTKEDAYVIDFVGGVEDIKQKRLHLIGDVETRYREDPVRMLRALRCAAKLGFDIDEESINHFRHATGSH